MCAAKIKRVLCNSGDLKLDEKRKEIGIKALPGNDTYGV